MATTYNWKPQGIAPGKPIDLPGNTGTSSVRGEIPMPFEIRTPTPNLEGIQSDVYSFLFWTIDGFRVKNVVHSGSRIAQIAPNHVGLIVDPRNLTEGIHEVIAWYQFTGRVPPDAPNGPGHSFATVMAFSSSGLSLPTDPVKTASPPAAYQGGVVDTSLQDVNLEAKPRLDVDNEPFVNWLLAGNSQSNRIVQIPRDFSGLAIVFYEAIGSRSSLGRTFINGPVAWANIGDPETFIAEIVSRLKPR